VKDACKKCEQASTKGAILPASVALAMERRSSQLRSTIAKMSKIEWMIAVFVVEHAGAGNGIAQHNVIIEPPADGAGGFPFRSKPMWRR